MATEQDIQQHVYTATVRRGRPPHSAELATALGTTQKDVLETFRQLSSRRLLALAPGTGEIVMAPPFSAVPTPFRVVVGEQSYFANCVWDSYGIAAALHSDASIESSCACCAEPMSLAVRGGEPVATAGVAHFAVPAAQWWDDIAYT